MVGVTAQYPFGICPEFHGNSRLLSPETEFSALNFPGRVEYSRLNLRSKGHVAEIHSLPHVGDFTGENEPTPILDAIESPMNLKNLSTKELKQLANEVRSELSFIMAKAQKPSRSSLTVVELTVAIHYVFHAPVDKILWDEAEQTVAHKLLTGRRLIMQTLGEPNGHPGAAPDFESEFDPFGAGHGCNSISAGLGMAIARDFMGKRDRVVAVINNDTIMAGQVYEAMRNSGYLDSNMIVILNDSRHSLHSKVEEASKTPINALSSTLSKLQSSKLFRRFRELAKVLTKKIGKGMYEWAAKVDEYARGMIGPLGSTLFEELGLYYIGPVDGHNIEDLVCVLNEVASLDSMGPVLVHVITKEELEVRDNQMNAVENKIMEGVSSSDTVPCGARTYSDCFVEALISEAERHKDIVAVHAGMGMEPSLHLLKNVFAEKFFDVGMAEQHAVTFAAGLACGGLKPFCIIPSAFLQRAYDQVIHDVDRQKVPVRFIITGAGLVGSDGPIQCGAFDIAFMSCLPNMIVMAPSDEVELTHMVATAALIDDRPVCFRYPRGALSLLEHSIGNGIPIEVGKGRILMEGKDVALLGYGSMVQNCLRAHSLLSNFGVEVTVADARFCKPLDIKLIRHLCKNHSFLVTVEEGSIGGFASHVAQFLSLDGQLDAGIKWRPITLPDNYIEQASPKEQLAVAGLTGHHIAATALRVSSILDACLSEYDAEATFFDEGVRSSKQKQLEEKLLQLVQPAYQSMLGHIRSDAFERFKEAFEKALKGGKGFALAARECAESCISHFDEECTDAIIDQAKWDSSRVRDKLRRDVDAHIAEVRSAKLTEVTTLYETKLNEALAGPVEALLDGAGDDTWPTIRKLLQRETDTAVSGFAAALSGFEMDEESKDNMVLRLKDYARGVVEAKGNIEVSNSSRD